MTNPDTKGSNRYNKFFPGIEVQPACGIKTLIPAEIARITIGRKKIPGYFNPLRQESGILIPVYMREYPNTEMLCSYTESSRKKWENTGTTNIE